MNVFAVFDRVGNFCGVCECKSDDKATTTSTLKLWCHHQGLSENAWKKFTISFTPVVSYETLLKSSVPNHMLS